MLTVTGMPCMTSLIAMTGHGTTCRFSGPETCKGRASDERHIIGEYTGREGSDLDIPAPPKHQVVKQVVYSVNVQ